MAGTFIKLYNTDAEPDSAFFMAEGRIFFYASTVDKYAISGKNLIAGATEIIVREKIGGDVRRVETAVADGGSSLKRMSPEKIISGLKDYSVSLNVSMVLARQVLLSNNIINANISLLEGDEKIVRELSIKYYHMIDRLRGEYEKRKFPWIKEILKNHEASLAYKRGEAFFRSAEPVKITVTKNLADKTVDFERGEVICEENTPGSEMYILESGAIDVIIKGNRVATIEDSGTVFGEMALLLGEKRTATLKAKNTVVVTRIKKEDLRYVAEKQQEVIEAIAIALAKRHYYNIIKIGGINRSIAESSLRNDEERKTSPLDKTRKELASLKRDVEAASKGKDASFLDDILAEDD